MTTASTCSDMSVSSCGRCLCMLPYRRPLPLHVKQHLPVTGVDKRPTEWPNAQQQPLQPKRIFSGSVETARGLQSDCLRLCTPGMGVSVGVQVPCRRFTFMDRKIHEDNYESKARASP